jgi:serine/threonine-protein kinase
VPKLLDFGIAKSVEARDATDVILGSAPYIAPERIKGKPYDGRADVYSTGMMFYRLLTGVLPFDHDQDDFEAIARWHLQGELPPPSWKRTGLNPAIDKAAARLLERNPLWRPKADEAEAMVNELVQSLPR